MRRVVAATWQAMRAEYSSVKEETLTDRFVKKAEQRMTLIDVARVDGEIQATHKKVEHLGATYWMVLEEGYRGATQLTWRANHWWYPLWPGRIAHFVSDYLVGQCAMIAIVAGCQAVHRLDKFDEYARQKVARDYIKQHRKD
jgi:hypothetical protein